MGRAVRRHGAAPVAAVGATVLAIVAWLAVAAALGSRPEPPPRRDAFLEPGMRVAVAVDTGPHVQTVLALAALLIGAALTVLASAKLSPVDREIPDRAP